MAEAKTDSPDLSAVLARLAAAEARLASMGAAPVAAPKPAPKLTGEGTHRATQRGYAIPQTDPPEARAGVLVGPEDEIQIIPAKVPISEEWMEPVKKGDSRLARAVEEAGQDHPTDVDLTALNKSALQAMAAERGINVEGLTKDDLITAIKAEREPTI